jgi:predicted site-specific integrase-resolvase
MLSTNDIRDELGVNRVTVERWIRQGKLKASKNNNRSGWMITQEDYEAFLEKNTRWNSIRLGDAFTQKELKTREMLITVINERLRDIDKLVKSEMREERYMKGYERAVKELQIILNRELVRKSPA